MPDGTIGLVTATASRELDEDLPLLLDAAAQLGIDATVVCWDDAHVRWSEYAAVVLRSPWDYHERYDEFLAWLAAVEGATTVHNHPDVVRWSTDKHYLAELAAAGLPVTPTTFVEPGSTGWALPATTDPGGDVVVKPAVSAGSTNTARYPSHDRAAIGVHVDRLTAAGRSVLIQPYLDSVDTLGETALLYIGGTYSHAARKGPMLASPIERVGDLFAREDIRARQPSDAERHLGDRVLAEVGRRFPGTAYARVDLLATATGPVVLEVELAEPSLFLPTCPTAAVSLLEWVRQAPPH